MNTSPVVRGADEIVDNHVRAKAWRNPARRRFGRTSTEFIVGQLCNVLLDEHLDNP
jgi:hypothetical protein